MNIIYLKQAVKAKVNTVDTSKEIKKIVNDILGPGEVESKIIKTANIDGAGAGCSVLLATTNKSSRLMLTTIGASCQDITCVVEENKKIEEVVRSFEYTMFMSKKVAGITSLSELDNEGNKDFNEAIQTIARIATNARHRNLIAGNYGEVLDKDTDSRYSGVVITDLMNKDRTSEIDLEVIGRRGKTHLLQVVPLLKEELEIIKEFEDSAIADVIATSFISSEKDVFTNRRKLFNFSDVINAHTVDREKLEKAGIEFEKDKPLINTLEHVNIVLELKSN